MTNAEMDADVFDLQAYLGCTSLSVDRCRHASVTESALWAFGPNAKHIASVSRNVTTSKYKWRVNKMANGGRITEMCFETLLDAATYDLRYCYDVKDCVVAQQSIARQGLPSRVA